MSRPGSTLAIYASLAAAAAVGTTYVLTRGPKIHKGQRLFVVGDSLSIGLSVPLKKLATDAGITFGSLGKVGTKVFEWSSNNDLYSTLATFKPDLVLVSLGTNDEYLNASCGPSQAPCIHRLWTRLKDLSPEVGWIGPPTLPKIGTNGVIGLIQHEVPGNRYFNSQDLSIPRAGDKLHPTALGYAMWAAEIWKWIT